MGWSGVTPPETEAEEDVEERKQVVMVVVLGHGL